MAWGSLNDKIGSMKTTIDIPDDALEEVMRHTGAATKREAVLVAIEEFNRRRRGARLASKLGKSATFMSQAELKRLRSE